MSPGNSSVLDEEALAKRQFLDSLEEIRARIEKKNVFKNLKRCLSEDQRAQNKASALNRAREERCIQQYEYEKDEQLSRELCEMNRKEMAEKKMRQHLRQNCPELKELETKLRAAYINKEIIAQLAEKEAKRVHDKIKEKEVNKLLAEARYSDQQYRNHEIQKDINNKAQYRQDLQDQMIYKERMRRFDYDQYLQEKKTIDDITERMFDEDERTREEDRCKKVQLQEEIETFKAAQQFWKDKHKAEIDEEHRKMQEYIFTKANNAQEKKDERERKEAAKYELLDKMALEMYEAKRKQNEREDILLELLEEEKKESIEKRAQADIEKEAWLRADTLRSLTMQMEEHKEKIRKQAEEDALYKEQLIAKIAEDERLEQLSNEKKRLKMIAVRKMVEQQMAEHRQLKAEEMQRQMRLLEIEQKEAEEKNRLIQEERIRILKEHGDHLVGFMPKGSIEPDDVRYLGSDVVNQWCQKNEEHF